MYYQIQKADQPTIRDTDHPFSIPNQKKTQKTDQEQKKIIHTFAVYWERHMHQLRDQLRLDSLMGPAVATSTDGSSFGYIY